MSIDATGCLQKQELLKQKFSRSTTQEDVYQAIIDLGKQQILLPREEKIAANLVSGCQSQMYLSSRYHDGIMTFQTESDALISAGLGQLMVFIYQDEKPEVVLTCPPRCLQELGIPASLTPGRANGLASIYHAMKQRALRALTQI